MRYYHGSNRPIATGTELKGRGDRYENEWGSCDFFWALEIHRPEGFLAHKDAVFMVADLDDIDLAGGATDWCCEMEPTGHVTRHDLNWSSEISCLIGDGKDIRSQEVVSAAASYWNGVPHPNESVWEYISASAVVTACYALDADVGYPGPSI